MKTAGIHTLSLRCSKHPVSRSASQPSASPCVATFHRKSLDSVNTLLVDAASSMYIFSIICVHQRTSVVSTLFSLHDRPPPSLIFHSAYVQVLRVYRLFFLTSCQPEPLLSIPRFPTLHSTPVPPGENQGE